jgi:DNA helicase IV
MLSDNSLTPDKDKVVVNSIDSIKGQEGKKCVFILTTDLAAYLFGEKADDTTTKHRLYVALTRSLDKLTIFITNEVETKYKRENIVNFFEKILNTLR